MWLFYYFSFEKNYDILKSKSPCTLLNKTLIKTKRNRKWKIPHSFRERNLVLCRWSSRKKKRGHFCTVYFVRKNFFKHLCFISIYSVLNTLSKYTYFYISENNTSYTSLLVFKIIESLQCILSIAHRGIKLKR